MATTTCTEISCERSGVATQNNTSGSVCFNKYAMKIPRTKEEIVENLRKDTKDYVEYWKKRWSTHPLNIGMGKGQDLTVKFLDLKHDWQQFVEIHDIVYHYTDRYMRTKKMPYRSMPKEIRKKLMWDKHGRNFEVDVPYQTLYTKTAGPDDTFCELQLLTSMPYHQKYRYKFTYANFEAALYMTKRVWMSRCHYKKQKDNIAYVIIPMCFQVLYMIAQIFDGTYAAEEEYNQKLEAWGEANKTDGTSDKWWGEDFDTTEGIGFIGNGESLVHSGPPSFDKFCEEYDQKKKEETEKFCDELKKKDKEPEGFILLKPEDMERHLELDAVLPEAAAIAEEVAEEPMEVDLSSSEEEVKNVTEEEEGEDETDKNKVPSKVVTMAEMASMLEEIERMQKEEEQIAEEIKQEIIEKYYDNSGDPPLTEPFVNDMGELETPHQVDMWTNEGWKVIRKKQKWERDRYNCEWPFKFFPKITKLPFKHSKKCPAETDYGVLPIFSPWEMKKCYFENLPEIYLRIGRPELAARACCTPAKLFWKKQLRQYGMIADNAWMNTMYERLNEIGRQRVPPNFVEEEEVFDEERLLGDVLEEEEPEDEVDKVWGDWSTFCPKVVRDNCGKEREPQSAEGLGKPGLQAAAPGGGKAGGPVTGGEKIEEPVKSGEKHVTMTFVDQREIQKAAPKSAKKETEEDHAVKEIYNMQNVMKRPQQIGKVVWSTTNERMKELVRYVLPFAYFSANSSKPEACEPLTASYVMSMFGATKFDMKVRIVCNSVKFQQGRLLGVFVPFYKTERSDFNMNCMTNYPHVFIDASTSNPVEIAIPWTNIRDSFPIYADPHHEITYFGTFHLFVWNALQTGKTGSTDATITTYMWLENVENYQLTNPKAPNTVTFASNVITDLNHVMAPDPIERHIPSKKMLRPIEREPQGSIGGLLEGAADIALETGANAIEKLLQQIVRGANSKPAGFMPPQPVVPWVASNGAHGEGVDLSQRLCLEPLSVTRPDKSMSAPKNISDLVKEWSRIGVFKWSVSDEENKSLATVPVCPMLPTEPSTFRNSDMRYGFIDTAANTCKTDTNQMLFQVEERYPSLLEYLAMGFHYWRGAIKFRFEVVKTAMHSGRLYLRYEPYGTPKTATKECEKQATPGWVWDVQEKSIIDVEVPFTTLQPYLSTKWHPQPGQFPDNLIGNVACGLIELVVLNRMKVTTGISDSVEINLYLAGGSDFELFAPRPVEGIITFGKWTRWVVNKKEKSRVEKFWDLIGTWWDNILLNMKQSNLTEVIQINGVNYRRMINRTNANAWRVPGKSSSQFTYMYMRKALEPLLAEFKKVGIIIPDVGTQEGAYQWLNSLPRSWPASFQERFNELNWEPTDLLWDKFLWATTFLVLKEKLDRFKHCPRLAEKIGDQWYHLFMVKEVAEEREPQSNEKAQGPGINPFTVFRPGTKSTKELSGENHMDMYKIMKRFSLWKTLKVPDDVNVKQDATDWIKGDYKWLLPNLANMSSWEAEEYVWELRLPVTPYTRFDIVGDDRTWLSPDADAHRKYAGAPPLALGSIDGGIALGTQESITWSRFYGQLFTFWRGSLRYRFTFPDLRTDDPNWMMVVYSPEEYSNAPQGYGQWRLANSQQMRSNSQLGSVLMNGNIMANVDIEVPFYSQFSRLCMSERFDKTSTAGSLLVYLPLRFEQKGECTPGNLASKLRGFKTWIWTAVGDDFEYQVPRQAPWTVLWPAFAKDTMDWDHYHTGYDRDVAEVSGAVKSTTSSVRRVVTTNWDVNEIQSIESMVSGIPTDVLPKDTDYLKIVLTKVGIDEKWDTKKALAPEEEEEVKEKDEREREPQGDEGVQTEKELITVQGVDDIDGIISDAVRGVKTFTKVVGQIESALDPFLANVISLTDKCEKSLDKITNEVSDSAGYVKTGVEYAINGTRVGMFFYGIHQMLQAETWQERWLPLATCALSLGLSPDVVTRAGEWVVGNAASILSSEKVNEKRVPEAWEDTWNSDIGVFLTEHACTLRMIAAGIVTILTFYMTPTLPSAGKVKSFAVDMVNKLRNMAFVGAGLKSLEWMFKWVANVIKEAAMWVADTFSGGLVSANRLSAHYPEVLEWLKNVERYDVEGYKAPLAYDHGARIELWKLIDKGNELNSKLSSRSGPLYHTITRGMVKLNKLDSESTSLKNTPAFRMDPIHICFYGEAGVKKSSILTYVLNFLADELGYPVTNRFYARNEAEDHWNGYCGQLITLMDDLGQIKDGKGVEELISMKSNVAWHVPMAHLEDKGKSFASKIIGSTTNVLFPKPDNVVHHPALWRRRNVLIEVYQLSAFGDTTVNKWNNLRFNLLDPFPDGKHDQKRKLREGLTLTDLMVFLVETTKRWEKRQHALVYAGLQGRVMDLPEFEDAKNAVKPASNFYEEIKSALSNGTVYTYDRLEKIFDSLTVPQVIGLLRDPETSKSIHKTTDWEVLDAIYRLVSKAVSDLVTVTGLEDEHDRYLYLEVLRKGPTAAYMLFEDDDKGLPISVTVVKNGKFLYKIDMTWTKSARTLQKKPSSTGAVKKKAKPKESEEEYFSPIGEEDKKVLVSKSLKEELEEEPEWEEDPSELSFIPNDERVTHPGEREPNGLSDEVREMYDESFSGFAESWQELKSRAENSLKRREELITSFDEIVTEVCDMPVKRNRVRLANEEEIKNFVATYYPKLSLTEQSNMAKQFKEAFDRVHKNDSHWAKFAADAQTSENLKELFTEKYDKYWTKIDNVWVIKSDSEDEDGVNAFCLYAVLEEKYTAAEISKMKENAPDPSKYKISQMYGVVKKFYDNQKSKLNKWLEEHPTIFRMIKLAGALAGIFVGYKLLNWICPTIIDKIKASLAALFGWSVAKIGEDRVNAVKEKGKQLAAWGKRKVNYTLEYVRSLMRGSDDTDVQEWAENPDIVQLYAESLETVESQAKTAVKQKLRALSAEGKVKKSVMNAYMLGQDRVQEGKIEPSERLSAAKDPRVYEPHGCSDENSKRIRDNVITKNMVRATWSSTEKTMTMNGVFIRGRHFMIPYHFWNGCEKGQAFVLSNRSGACLWEVFDPANCRKVEGCDLTIYLCSKRVGNFADLLKHFPEEVRVQQTPAALMTMTSDCMFTVQAVEAFQVSDVTYKLSSGEKVVNMFAWEYAASTEKGDCGALLIADNVNMQKKILGMHVCGVKGENIGNAAYVTATELRNLMNEIPDDSEVKPTCYVPQCLITKGVDAMKIRPFGNFDLHGAVDKKHEVQLPHKTEIQPSPIHDLVREHVTEPSVLLATDPRLKEPGSPLLRAIEKYGNPTIPFPKEDLDMASEYIESEIMTWKRPMEPRLLTDHEAVFGNEGIEFCDRMNLGASPGYPWTLTRPSGEKGKAYLFDINAEDGIADENFRREYQLREALAKKGIRKVSVWTDCLKDERRPLEKIAKGKTRAFMLPPADYVMLCRKYLMAFNVCFYHNRINSFSAVGVDPYSFEWTRIVRKLKKNSNLVFGGDFHAFDGIFDALFMWRICKFINAWFKKYDKNWKPEDDVVRQVIFEEMIHTIHICINSVYEKHQGNPSGSPVTVITNTFAHIFYLVLAWIGLARRYSPENMSIHKFEKAVAALAYGDDGIYSVKLQASEWFNCKTVSEYLKEFGIEYTDESKSANLYGVKSIYECTFLKNGFVKMPGSHIWLAPINKDTIYELTNWVRKSDDPVAQMRANLADVFAFAVHHGEEFFRELSTKVNKALESRGLRTFPVSYKIEMERFLSKCLN